VDEATIITDLKEAQLKLEEAQRNDPSSISSQRILDASLRKLKHYSDRRFIGFYINQGWSPQDAEEIANDVMYKIFEKLSQCDENPTAWMWRIARNIATDQWRKQKNKPITNRKTESLNAADTDKPPPVELITDGLDKNMDLEVRKCVVEALVNFTENYPEMGSILDWRMDNVRQKEIADRIGRSYDATRQLMRQALDIFAPLTMRCNELAK
jgi:RNA polymerase sigma factor (sigma-70 family)